MNNQTVIGFKLC